MVQTILQDEPTAAITAITGLDLGDNIGIMYHIRLRHNLVTLIVEVEKTRPTIRSITD